MKKTIYSLAPLRELLLAANRRYLEFISTIEDDKAGTDKLNKISQPVEESERRYRGFNFFDPQDEELFRSLGSGEFNISGFQNKDLRRRLSDRNSGQISRTMKRLRTRLDQKGWPHLQVLPHRTRQTVNDKPVFVVPWNRFSELLKCPLRRGMRSDIVMDNSARPNL